MANRVLFDRRVVEVAEPLPGVPRRDTGIRHLTEEDRPADMLESTRRVVGLPASPSLVSSAHGEIEHLLIWCPHRGYTPQSVQADLLRLLPPATKVTAVASADAAAELEATASEVCPGRDVSVLTAPDWLDFTVWAEDAFVVVRDGSDGAAYLVEPEAFGRAGDYLLAEMSGPDAGFLVAQAPLAFQGGNVLIGNDFVLIGRDYLDESIPVAAGSVVGFPFAGTSDEQAAFVASFFRQLLDPAREFHFLASEPQGRAEDGVVQLGGERWRHTVSAGRGQRQPIFHIDMFVTLVGPAEDGGDYRVLVGDPGEADRLLGWEAVDHNLQGEFDEIAGQLATAGFQVIRTPLPYVPVAERASEPFEFNGVLVVGEIVWYHATSNNCLVQVTADSREVWLPTYGVEPFPELSATDEWFADCWESLGFTVHQLGDFHPFARAMGALHCIKKYLSRRSA